MYYFIAFYQCIVELWCRAKNFPNDPRIAMVSALISRRLVRPHTQWRPRRKVLIGWLVPDACLPRLNLRFSLALTIYELWAVFFVSSLCVNFNSVVSMWWYIAIIRKPPCELNIFFVLTTTGPMVKIWCQWNTFKHPQWLRLVSVLRWGLCCCWFFPYCCSHFRGSVFVSFFVAQCVAAYLVLHSSWLGRESWLLYFVCLPGVLWLLLFCGSSWRCHGLVYNLWFWYFLIILTFL